MNALIQTIIVYIVLAATVVWVVVRIVRSVRHKDTCTDCPLHKPGTSCSCHRKQDFRDEM